jgi:hypothetical protein
MEAAGKTRSSVRSKGCDEIDFPKLREAMHWVARQPRGWLITLALAAVTYLVFIFFSVFLEDTLGYLAVVLLVAAVFLFEPTYRSLWAGEPPAYATTTRAALRVAVLWTAALWVLAVSVFASASFVAWRAHAFEVSPAPSTDVVKGSAKFVLLYVWELLDTLPGIDATDTLAWNPPLKYEGEALGIPVLIYKLSVLLPLIAAFRGVWATRGQRSPSPATAPDSVPPSETG